ncbi:hypothetical protein MKZ38_002575 [Zalerion maritima]|uniref:Uncharacterized protein n=1 Tax=Zalerion maritima TaxID=339359 RepID=A0AAD5RNR0_9PEZI|nr:hypothetical protein MKZ38_002575 [Zalerion maritima]
MAMNTASGEESTATGDGMDLNMGGDETKESEMTDMEGTGGNMGNISGYNMAGMGNSTASGEDGSTT